MKRTQCDQAMNRWLKIEYFLVIAIGLYIFTGWQQTYGFIDPEPYKHDPELVNRIIQVNYLESLVDYCFEHADRSNPLQDLKDKGISVIGSDCKKVNQLYNEKLESVNKMMSDYTEFAKR